MTPQASVEPFWYGMLPRLGTAAEFAAVRGIFAEAGFDYANVCRYLGVEHIYKFRPHMIPALLEQPLSDALAMLVRIFVVGYSLEEADIQRILGAASMDALRALELLHSDAASPNLWFSPVLILPVPGAVIACDRYSGPDGSDLAVPPADVVYLPVFEGTMAFVARLPEIPCDAMLEIGTGAGSAAIRSAPYARRVWATDITRRAVHFAAFNCGLAGAGNVRVLEGDLYRPVEGLTFDRIASHPPYVPAKKSKTIFREGGEDGEQIARRIVEGLPQYLRCGGEFWGRWMGANRKNERFEQRLRKWLGAAENQFDIAIAVDSVQTPQESIATSIAHGNTTIDELTFFRDLWKGTDTETLVHASVLIRRHDGSRQALTVSCQTGDGFEGRHLQWLLEWQVATHGPGGLDTILATRPRLSPFCRLHANYSVHEGQLVPDEFVLESVGPLKGRCKCPQWLVAMASECDGSRTVSELFDRLQAGGQLPPEAGLPEFAGMLAALVASCVLLPSPAASVQ
jgi:hypothetical protein